MKDPRYYELARTLVTYSVNLQRGEKVLIETVDLPPEMVVALIREADAAGAVPLVATRHSMVLREMYRTATEESMRAAARYEIVRLREVDAYIGIRCGGNILELSDVPPERMACFRTHWYGPVHIDVRVPQTRWVVLRFPGPALAQQAGMSTEAFEDFYFQVCTMDYGRMSRAMDPLKRMLEAADRVHLTGPGTDLRFSIQGQPVVKCDGRQNIPDGEVFTAPVRESVEGEIAFNAHTIYQGATFENVQLRFRKGKVVEARADRTEALNGLLDQDEGARYVGEFAISFNPHITRPMLDVLFDEKIAGAFHLALGASYHDADNGNRSDIHWDLVMLQAPANGGGEIYLDDHLIRKDGRFVVPELEGLNPENLV